MKLSYKLILGYLLVASLASFITFFALHSYQKIDGAFVTLMREPVPIIQALEDHKASGFHIISSTNEICFILSETAESDDSTLVEEEQQLVDAGLNKYQESLTRYAALTDVDNVDDLKFLELIKKDGDALIQNSGQMIAMKKSGVAGKEILEKKEEFEEQERAYLQDIDHALADEYSELAQAQRDVHATITEATNRTLLVTFLTFLLAIISGLYISRHISNRITKLKEASEDIGRGEMGTIIEIKTNDEIGDLARSFNKMVGDLYHSRTELVSTKNFVDNIVSSIADVLFVLDMDLKIIRLNRTAVDLTRYDRDELIGHSIRMLHTAGKFFNAQDVEELQATGYVRGLETSWQTKDKREVSILFSASIMRDSKGGNAGIVCVAQDITVRKSLENQLTHQALHDSLTKLANRALFHNRVEHALARISRNHEPIAVLFLDLDNFKRVNDTLGHEAGDTLLVSVAERLVTGLRPSDTVARLGGDEFAVLIESMAHIDEITMVAERLNDVLRESFLIDGKELFIHTSIGIAVSGTGNEKTEELLRNADVAMYKAKSQGKDQYVFFENRMHEDLVEKIEFEADLRRAIEGKEFILHYQPIINLALERIIGMEALVRWNHPQHGLIPPFKFIPIAEETGLIIPLGQWVLEEACRQARRWQIEYDDRQQLSITVNLSTKQVQEENLIGMVAFALAESDLPAHNLILEITEGTMLHDTEATIRKLTELKELGVRLAIDDFGTGYSSLSYLQRFPVDVLKIDKSFVDKISQSREGAAVARAIITMSDTLHLKTIAEGIETDEQNVALQNLGCEFGQGYHFAKPLTKDAMSEYLGKANLSALLNGGTAEATETADYDCLLFNKKSECPMPR